MCWCSEGGGCDSEDSSGHSAGDPPLGPGPPSALPGGGGYTPPTGRKDAGSHHKRCDSRRYIAGRQLCRDEYHYKSCHGVLLQSTNFNRPGQ